MSLRWSGFDKSWFRILAVAGILPLVAFGEEEYRYNPGNLPDPFKPMQLSKPPILSMSPLQDYNLSDLILVGTLLGAETSALIVTPAREGVIARVGDKIGRDGGRIVVIARDRIVIRQPIAEKTFSYGTSGSRQKFEDLTMPLVRKSEGGIAGSSSSINSSFSPGSLSSSKSSTSALRSDAGSAPLGYSAPPILGGVGEGALQSSAPPISPPMAPPAQPPPSTLPTNLSLPPGGGQTGPGQTPPLQPQNMPPSMGGAPMPQQQPGLPGQ